MGTKVIPTLDRVLLRRINPQEETAAGGLIYLPEASTEKAAFEAQVLACGPGAMVQGAGFQPVPLKGGERVLVHRGGLTEIRLEGQTYYVGRYDNIMLVFQPEKVENAQGIADYLGIDAPALVPPPMVIEEQPAAAEEVSGD